MDSEPSFKKVETVVKLDCVSVTFENYRDKKYKVNTIWCSFVGL